MAVFLILVLILAVAGTIFYGKLINAMHGIIGPVGAYMAATGICALGVGIVTFFSPDGSTSEALIGIGAGLLLCGYLAFVMLTRCRTVGQRIALPFAALLIAFGFCLRLMLKIFLHMPMPKAKDKTQASVFPELLYGPDGEMYRLQHAGGDNASYQSPRTGQQFTIRDSDVVNGLPSGWRAG